MTSFSIRLTHKIMAIGVVGLVGLLAFKKVLIVAGVVLVTALKRLFTRKPDSLISNH